MDIRIINLSHNINDRSLSKVFSAFGIVDSAEVLKNKINGRSRGNALVMMPVEAEARLAILSLNQTMLDGKKISVSQFIADPQW